MDRIDALMDILGRNLTSNKIISNFPAVSTQVREARYCYLEPHVSRTPKLRVSCAGKERCDPDYRVSRKSFAGYGLEFIVSGLGEVILDGKSWPLRPGTLFCYGPRTSHIISTEKRNPMT